MRAIILVFCAVALSNCVGIAAVPPVVTYLSAGATVFSYMPTGKGTSDHVISAIVEQDCALHRALLQDEICSQNGVPLALTEAEVMAYLAE